MSPQTVYGIWREWKELREGEEVSKTTYQGLEVRFGEHQFLFADLSHGIRILSVTKNPEKYQFVDAIANGLQDTNRVVVPEDFLRIVKEAFDADQKLQEQIGVFNRLRFESIHGDGDHG